MVIGNTANAFYYRDKRNFVVIELVIIGDKGLSDVRAIKNERYTSTGTVSQIKQDELDQRWMVLIKLVF